MIEEDDPPPGDAKKEVVEVLDDLRRVFGITYNFEGHNRSRVSVSGETPTGTDVLLSLTIRRDGSLCGIYDRPINRELADYIRENYDGEVDIKKF